MERSRREQFDRKFAAFVGKLPFPGRHDIGPVAVHALRTPNIDEKLADRKRIAGFRFANLMTGGVNSLGMALDAHYLYSNDAPVWLAGGALAANGVVAACSFASAKAQSFLIDRIDRSIEAASNPNAPWEVGIESQPPDTVEYESRWPASVKKRDKLVLAAFSLATVGLQFGLVGQQIARTFGEIS